MNNLYIHTEKCRVESDNIKDLKYLVKAQKGDTIYEKRNFGYWSSNGFRADASWS
ncbi:hypothetical protein BC30052_0147 [Bacillus cereus]|nr:hypothetical protein BC30052_0147 [Bacillus cereus]